MTIGLAPSSGHTTAMLLRPPYPAVPLLSATSQSAGTPALMSNRLAPDFESDASTWVVQDRHVLNLRHEVGVVEHADGQTYAIAVLTESRVVAGRQPGADALMGQVARRLRDELRSRWTQPRRGSTP